jgi:hypothetical protein
MHNMQTTKNPNLCCIPVVADVSQVVNKDGECQGVDYTASQFIGQYVAWGEVAARWTAVLVPLYESAIIITGDVGIKAKLDGRFRK